MPRVSINRKKYMIKDFPGWAKEMIKKKGFKQEKVAERMNMSQQSLSQRLCGKIEFTYSELVDLFEILELPEEDIIRWMVA